MPLAILAKLIKMDRLPDEC